MRGGALFGTRNFHTSFEFPRNTHFGCLKQRKGYFRKKKDLEAYFGTKVWCGPWSCQTSAEVKCFRAFAGKWRERLHILLVRECENSFLERETTFWAIVLAAPNRVWLSVRETVSETSMNVALNRTVVGRNTKRPFFVSLSLFLRSKLSQLNNLREKRPVNSWRIRSGTRRGKHWQDNYLLFCSSFV